MTKSKLAIIGVLTVAALAASAVYAGKNKSEDEIDAVTLAKTRQACVRCIQTRLTPNSLLSLYDVH